jgi:hypothetical protein
MIHRNVSAVLAKATPTARRLRSLFSTKRWMRVLRTLDPSLVSLSFAAVAHAQGTMDFSGAQTLMTTFNPRFAYVSVSRAAHDAHIFTNDASTLATALSHDATKTSAVTIGQATSGGIEHGVGLPPATDIGAGFSL